MARVILFGGISVCTPEKLGEKRRRSPLCRYDSVWAVKALGGERGASLLFIVWDVCETRRVALRDFKVGYLGG